jgi:dolichol kinase
MLPARIVVQGVQKRCSSKLSISLFLDKITLRQGKIFLMIQNFCLFIIWFLKLDRNKPKSLHTLYVLIKKIGMMCKRESKKNTIFARHRLKYLIVNTVIFHQSQIICHHLIS